MIKNTNKKPIKKTELEKLYLNTPSRVIITSYWIKYHEIKRLSNKKAYKLLCFFDEFLDNLDLEDLIYYDLELIEETIYKDVQEWNKKNNSSYFDKNRNLEYLQDLLNYDMETVLFLYNLERLYNYAYIQSESTLSLYYHLELGYLNFNDILENESIYDSFKSTKEIDYLDSTCLELQYIDYTNYIKLYGYNSRFEYFDDLSSSTIDYHFYYIYDELSFTDILRLEKTDDYKTYYYDNENKCYTLEV